MSVSLLMFIKIDRLFTKKYIILNIWAYFLLKGESSTDVSLFLSFLALKHCPYSFS